MTAEVTEGDRDRARDVILAGDSGPDSWVQVLASALAEEREKARAKGEEVGVTSTECRHVGATSAAGDITYPDYVKLLENALDLTHEKEAELLDLLVEFALGRVNAPRDRVIELLRQHYPDGPDLRLLEGPDSGGSRCPTGSLSG